MAKTRLNREGKINLFLILFVVAVLLLIGASSFGYWAFSGRQDYKNNVDSKIATAVDTAKKNTEATKDKEFAEKEKSPIKDYRGPAAYGSVVIKYPKTWSAYVIESAAGNTTPVDGYFHPSFVPGIQSGTSYALRLQVISRPYDQELKQFEGAIKQGRVKAIPYKAANVAAASVGVRLEGEIAQNKQGTMVVLSMRDKTLKVWTEASQFQGDFDNIVLQNMTFAP